VTTTGVVLTVKWDFRLRKTGLLRRSRRLGVYHRAGERREQVA
jgi:hypothetical protein